MRNLQHKTTLNSLGCAACLMISHVSCGPLLEKVCPCLYEIKLSQNVDIALLLGYPQKKKCVFLKICLVGWMSPCLHLSYIFLVSVNFFPSTMNLTYSAPGGTVFFSSLSFSFAKNCFYLFFFTLYFSTLLFLSDFYSITRFYFNTPHP